jgi:hypothetical protein
MKIIEETINSDDAALVNAKYIKIYISSESGNQVIDVMLSTGLRLSFDAIIGKPKDSIKFNMKKLAMTYRSHSCQDITNIDLIADCIADCISHEEKIISYDMGSGLFHKIWLERLLAIILRKYKDYVYEWIIDCLMRYYDAPTLDQYIDSDISLNLISDFDHFKLKHKLSYEEALSIVNLVFIVEVINQL